MDALNLVVGQKRNYIFKNSQNKTSINTAKEAQLFTVDGIFLDVLILLSF
tara:strand:- start:2384 stop:2533 length:150 start_codon:yes stop_codon:yes gene_type:complete